MNLTKIITFVCLGISLYLGYYLYGSIQGTIDSRKLITVQEAVVIEKLQLIKEAEVLFQGFYGNYTANWDSLTNFIKTAQIPIIERREEIIQKAYGGEDIIVHIDTLGFVTAWEKLFKKKFTMSATEDGIFMGFKVKKGARVIKNQRAYLLKVGEKVLAPPFSEEGVIDNLTDIQPGASVKKGEILVNFWDYRFDPNTDLNRIGYKPGIEGVQFDIFVGTVDKKGLAVGVIEVKDPTPDDPRRSENNEMITRKPLRFGSRKDVSTAGNWE